MPEIIQFSNSLCYQSEPLVPLREYGAIRLVPVRTSHVPDGYLSGKTSFVNNPEAEAVVNEIVRCCGDTTYDGKTFEVISLQGPKQAQLIASMLLERLGPKSINDRDLVCGDAYAFQGDERDVIFLTMVAAPKDTGRIGVLSKESDKRRFNVAASRARDQMWLFHSVQPDDLSPLCLRRQFLE